MKRLVLVMFILILASGSAYAQCATVVILHCVTSSCNSYVMAGTLSEQGSIPEPYRVGCCGGTIMGYYAVVPGSSGCFEANLRTPEASKVLAHLREHNPVFGISCSGNLALLSPKVADAQLQERQWSPNLSLRPNRVLWSVSQPAPLER